MPEPTPAAAEEVFTGGSSKRKTRSETAAEKTAAPKKDPSRQNLIIVVCPPFALTSGAVKALSGHFQLYQAETVKNFKIPKEQTSQKHHLLLVQSLYGVVEAAQKDFNVTLFVYKSNRTKAD